MPLDFGSMHLWDVVAFCRLQRLKALCVCVVAAAGAFCFSEKGTPLRLGSMYLVEFVIVP